MDSNQRQRWNISTSLCFWGSAIQSIFTFICLSIILYVVYNIVDIIIEGAMSSITSMNFDYFENRFLALFISVTICSGISFIGFVLYLIGICLFKNGQRSPNSELRARNIMLTELIMLGLTIFIYIALCNWVKEVGTAVVLIVLICILSLSAIIYLILQYKGLSYEDTWSKLARKGADDVKFSYSCIIWILVALIFGGIIIGFTGYSYYSKFESLKNGMYGGYDPFYGLNSAVNMMRDVVTIIKIEIMFISLFVFIFGLLLTIYRIMGWRKMYKGGNDEIMAEKFNDQINITYSGPNRYCTKCGNLLPPDSSFCPTCGVPVMSQSIGNGNINSPINEDSVEADESQTYPINSGMNSESDASDNLLPEYDNYTDENEKKRKMLIYGGVIIAVIAVSIAVWAIWLRNDSGSSSTALEESAMEYLINGEANNTDENKDLSFLSQEESSEISYEEDYDDGPVSDDNGYVELRGKINGKYDIVMELTILENGEVSGSYYYTSKNIPISLAGTVGVDDVLTLEEQVNGEVTGTFVGMMRGKQYSGSWVSANGDKEMPFAVSE